MALRYLWHMVTLQLVLLLFRGNNCQRVPRTHSRQGGQRGFRDILAGVNLNILDSKFIGLGYVRQELVDELCIKAAAQLVWEGESRALRELSQGGIVEDLTSQVTERCSDLVGEGERACDGVIEMIDNRFDGLEKETVAEARLQCENTKKLTIDMVKKGAEAAYKSSEGLGKQLAEAEFRRQVETEKNRGERMFQEEVEKNRGFAEQELRRQVKEGRAFAENKLNEEVEKGKIEAEKIYADTIEEERAKAEKVYQATVDEKIAEAEVIFAQEVAKGRKEAEKVYQQRALEGREKGEELCGDMITVACQNVTKGTSSDDFCEDFFFFTGDLRRKRENRGYFVQEENDDYEGIKLLKVN